MLTRVDEPLKALVFLDDSTCPAAEAAVLGATARCFVLAEDDGALTTLGIAAGLALLAATLAGIAPFVQAHYGIVLSAGAPSLNEWRLMAAILATGLLTSLVPGWRAWRLSLADGLTPRN